MTTLPRDYDSDPGRFLASNAVPTEDVHPHVADRLAGRGARTVLDVGGGTGKLARLLPDLGVRCLLLDLSPAMLALAPRPAVRADGSRLPIADSSVDAVAALYTLYHYDDPRHPIAEARRVLGPGGLFVACSSNRDSTPELAGVVPTYGRRSTFDGEDAPRSSPRCSATRATQLRWSDGTRRSSRSRQWRRRRPSCACTDWPTGGPRRRRPHWSCR